MTHAELVQRVTDAMWAKDTNTLIAHCEARLWNGCRSGLDYGEGCMEVSDDT